jgi:hypothetical protein
MAAECEINIIFVDDIGGDPSGKYRYFISEVLRPSIAYQTTALAEIPITSE